MATDYYVSPTGRDTNPGTRTQPFKTISRGIDVMSPGDTVYVLNGTYVEWIQINKSGRANAPLTIMALPGHSPVIDGRAGVDSLNSGLPNTELQVVNPFDGKGANYNGLINISGSYINLAGLQVRRSLGRGVRIASTPNASVSNIGLRDCALINSRLSGLSIIGIDSGGSELTCSEVVVENVEIAGSGQVYPAKRSPSVFDWPGALSIKGAEDVTLRGCLVHENYGEGLLVDANDGGARSILIEECTWYDNMHSCFLHAVQDLTFQRNYIYRSTVDKNTEEFGPTNGLSISSAESANYEQIPSENLRILNNIVVDARNGISLRGREDRQTISDVILANNTVINSSNAGLGVNAINVKNIRCFNNIVVASTDGKPVEVSSSTDEWTASHNLWSTRPNALNGTGDIIGDPRLVNVNFAPNKGEGDPNQYKLRAQSPAIDAGRTVSLVTVDFFGSRRDGEPDIGASEFLQESITADFSASPLEGFAPLQVAFQDKSIASPSITSWLWDFGDGSVSNQQNPSHTYNAGTYTVSLRVTNAAGSDIATRSNLITVEAVIPDNVPRVSEGLQALYRFDQRSGNVIFDVSGEGTPLDLIIGNPNKVQWTNNGLAIVEPTLIASNGPAEKINEACRASNAVSMEIWCQPANVTQDGPARIVSLSQNIHSRNLTLGQGLWGTQPSNVFDVRLRTTDRSANGMPSFTSPVGSATTRRSHIVFARRSNGQARVYLNGVIIAETTIPGDLSTWNPRFPLLIGSEATGDNPWLGQIHLVAVYDRWLSIQDVNQNYRAGPVSAATRQPTAVELATFRRFVLVSQGSNGFRGSRENAVGFGVQYPDDRCVVCTSNGVDSMTIYADVNKVLSSFKDSVVKLEWLD